MDKCKVHLKPMTRNMFHEYFREYENDLDLLLPGQEDLQSIYADAIKSNTRSQRVMEKAGFVFIKEDEGFKYYRIDR